VPNIQEVLHIMGTHNVAHQLMITLKPSPNTKPKPSPNPTYPTNPSITIS